MSDQTVSTAAAEAESPETALDLALKTVRRLERKLDRAAAENGELERLIEDKTRSLYLAQEELRGSKLHLEHILASMHSGLMITDSQGCVSSIGGRTQELTGWGEADLVGRPIAQLLTLEPAPTDVDSINELAAEAHEGFLASENETPIPVLVAVSTLESESGDIVGAVFASTDISERKRLELELRHAQRLESIGELAAGVAHEINTPIQYVSDGVRFIGEAIDDLLGLTETYRPLIEAAATVEAAAEPLAAVAATEAEIELPFLADELPQAITRTLDGVSRVATIVQALKQFSHPGSEELAPVDLNAIIDNTLVVARNEYKYVAEIDLQLGDIPDVLADAGDIGQVVLNLVVNAGHAIADRMAERGETGMGTITITTRSDDEAVIIDIADTGGGIPAEIRERVFEPFFTTKEPGKGTGQGLAIAHNQVVKKHGGRIDFDVEEGVGTTFHIWLPRERPQT